MGNTNPYPHPPIPGPLYPRVQVPCVGTRVLTPHGFTPGVHPSLLYLLVYVHIILYLLLSLWHWPQYESCCGCLIVIIVISLWHWLCELSRCRHIMATSLLSSSHIVVTLSSSSLSLHCGHFLIVVLLWHQPCESCCHHCGLDLIVIFVMASL